MGHDDLLLTVEGDIGIVPVVPEFSQPAHVISMIPGFLIFSLFCSVCNHNYHKPPWKTDYELVVSNSYQPLLC